MSRQLPADYETYELRKIKIGIRMTILYALVYTGFIFLAVSQPAWMGLPFLFGQNLAITYGLGLIVIAIIFALIYNYLLLRLNPKNLEQNTTHNKNTPKGRGD
jgi:uncharacterized membrane protein (DUF485 family)